MNQGLVSFDPMSWPLAPGWREVVDGFFASASGAALTQRIRRRLDEGAVIYPPQPLNMLALTPLSAVKVVVLGQDPYHGPGQAHGLAFSVMRGVAAPPSLRNIMRELERDPEIALKSGAFKGPLTGWAAQGVLLLNTCLTVEQAQPLSHAQYGWQAFTDAILAAVMRRGVPVVCLLWGSHAQSRAELITSIAGQSGSQATLLRANHPSPLSALRPPVPFIGCGHFSQTNRILAQYGLESISWSAFECEQVWSAGKTVA
jgi:uracil-DNA glycosylase